MKEVVIYTKEEFSAMSGLVHDALIDVGLLEDSYRKAEIERRLTELNSILLDEEDS